MSTKVAKPAHVPDALVFEFDYNSDPAYCRDPHARAAEIAQTAPPIFWTPHNGGHWMIQSHEAVAAALLDFERFSSEHFSPEAFNTMMAALPAEERVPAPVPICVDPPLHGKLRRPLFASFSPKAVLAREREIRALAERLIDAIVEKGYCEFQHDVADVYPVEIFLSMFGLPVEKEREYRDLAKKHLTSISPDLSENMLMMKSIASVVRDTVIERQSQPRNDLISLLWSLEIDGEPMTLDLMLSYCVILFIAGLDTVVNALGFGVRHLATDVQLQRELRANPELIPQATEELLRRYSFVAPIRIMKKDHVFHGASLKEGERVMMFLPAANIDARAYAQPTSFNLRREKMAHMAFGFGQHFCLGANLARLELKVMYETMLKKLPEFRLDPSRPPTYHGSIIAGPTSIHLAWKEGVSAGAPDPAPAPSTLASAPAPAPAVAAQGVKPGAPPSVEGQWTVTIHGPTGPQATLLKLAITGGALGGVQSALGQEQKLIEVSYDRGSGAIKWVNKVKKPLPLTLKFSGVVEGATMSGKVNAAIMGAFPFTGVKL